ncbi:MAG: caspase family protein [Bacteroidota bacterium]
MSWNLYACFGTYEGSFRFTHTETAPVMPDILISRDAIFRAKNYLLAIAINDYQHESDLYNCVKDAEDLIHMLTSEFDFNRENVSFLCGGEVRDEFQDLLAKNAQGEALKPNRRSIIRSLLDVAKRIAEDVKKDKDLKVNLILYYSGHGYFDKFLNQGYWIPWDAEKHDFASYISNSTLRDFLNRIPTHHTVLLADSCFSGSLFMTGEGKSVASSRLEKDKSRWGITAGRNEVVSDGKLGENSPFLKAILEELSRFDVIPISDLGNKVLERVAANDKQTPRAEPLRISGHEGGQYVFRKRKSARKNMEIGIRLMELAELAPEYDRYSAANDQFSVAHHLFKSEGKKKELLDCTRWQVKALCGMGALARACEQIGNTLEVLGGYEPAKELMDQLVKITYLDQKLLGETDFDQTQYALEKARQLGVKNPVFSEIETEIQETYGDVHLFSVGINKYNRPVPPLRSCLKDVENIHQAIQTHFERVNWEGEFHFCSLLDEEARRDSLLNELTNYGRNLSPDDLFIFSFSGHGIGEKENRKIDFLVPQDFDPKEWETISAEELLAVFDEYPTDRKLLIIDADVNHAVVSLTEEKGYAFISGGQPGDMIGDTREGGFFTIHFADLLRNPVEPSRFWDTLTSNVNRARKEQTPGYAHPHKFLRYFKMREALTPVLRTVYGPVKTKWKLEERNSLIESIEFSNRPYSQEEILSLARTLYKQEQYPFALKAYSAFIERVEKDGEGHGTELWKVYHEKALLHLEFAELEQAEKCLHESIEQIGDERLKVSHSLKRLLKKIQASKAEEKYALLVSTDPSADSILSGWETRLSDLGFKEIKVIKGDKVDKETLVQEFTWIADKAIMHPSFFCFIGDGELSDKGLPDTLLTFPENKDEHYGVALSELKPLCKHSSHLLSVLEVDFKNQDDSSNSLSEIQEPPLGNACFLSATKPPKGGRPLFQRWRENASLSKTMQAVLTNEEAPEFSELVKLISDELSVEEFI